MAVMLSDLLRNLTFKCLLYAGERSVTLWALVYGVPLPTFVSFFTLVCGFRWCFHMSEEKRRDLTQSYDKKPQTDKKIQKAT